MVHADYKDGMSQPQAEKEFAIEDERKSQESACQRIGNVLAGRGVEVIAGEVDVIRES